MAWCIYWGNWQPPVFSLYYCKVSILQYKAPWGSGLVIWCYLIQFSFIYLYKYGKTTIIINVNNINEIELK